MGSWRVVARLGVGGDGAVYRVEDMARPGDFCALMDGRFLQPA